MKRHLLCLILLCGAVFCFARGKQEVIVSENYSSEGRNVVVTIANKTEADFQTLVLTRKETLSDKWELSDRRTFSVRSGESKSVVLDNQGLYRLELYDGKGHKFSKKNTFSQIIKDKEGNVISEGEFQQFTQPWQKLVFTEEDFEPQAVIDIIEVFFGIYGNEKHTEVPAKSCSVIIVNNTGEQVDYISVTRDGNPYSSNLSIGKSQCGVLDIKADGKADISLISHSQHVYTKADLVFDAENLTVIFTAADREADGDKATRFISSALGSISSALSMTTEAFSSVFSRTDDSNEFETVESGTSSSGNQTNSEFVQSGTAAAQSASGAQADADDGTVQKKPKKSFWSWLPWVD